MPRRHSRFRRGQGASIAPASPCWRRSRACHAVAALVRGVPVWADRLYAGASALCFALYGIDKQRRAAGRDRISESMLLSLGVVGGWPGAIVAQQLWRHKTAKRTFRIRFWLSVAANAAIFAWLTGLLHLAARGA